MEVGQQKGTCGSVCAFYDLLFLGNVAAQLADHALHGAASFTQYAGLYDAPRCKSVLRFLDSGLHHIPAPARLNLHKAARLKLHQRLAHHGAADGKGVGQFLLPQPLAGRQLLGQYGFNHALGDMQGAYRIH